VKEWSAGGVGVGWAFQEQYASRGGYFLQGREQGNEGTRGQETKDLAEAERAGPAPGLDGEWGGGSMGQWIRGRPLELYPGMVYEAEKAVRGKILEFELRETFHAGAMGQLFCDGGQRRGGAEDWDFDDATIAMGHRASSNTDVN